MILKILLLIKGKPCWEKYLQTYIDKELKPRIYKELQLNNEIKTKQQQNTLINKSGKRYEQTFHESRYIILMAKSSEGDQHFQSSGK